MKSWYIILGCVFLLVCTLNQSQCLAADHYIRDGAVGAAPCSDWSDANACDVLPATLTRGDTYYIADGTYSTYVFDDTESGTTLITIKKAIIADHGTSTGWVDTYGDGVAVFDDGAGFSSGWEFHNDYYTVDGQVGGGPDQWKTGHGFKIALSYAGANPNPGVMIGSAGYGFNVNNITLSHFEVAGNNNVQGGGSRAQDGVAIFGPGGLNTIRYFYMHDLGRCNFITDITTDTTIEYGYAGTFNATGPQHAEAFQLINISGVVTVRYNIISYIHADSTGGIVIDTTGGGRVDIYGNVFARQDGDTWGGTNGGAVTGSTGFPMNLVVVVNNTFVNHNNKPGGRDDTALSSSFGTVTNSQVKNNLFYNVDTPGAGAAWNPVEYNHFINTTVVGTNTSTSAGDPFVNRVGLNFYLIGATTAGVTLSAPYNVDMYGKTRGSDGTWDRGAIEYTGGIRRFAAPPTSKNSHLVAHEKKPD